MFAKQLALAALAGFTHAAWTPTPDHNGYFGWKAYREKAADVKLKELWGQVVKDTTPAEVPYEALDDFFSQNMQVTLCRPGDEMKRGIQKVMHAQGVVGLIEWQDLGNHQYTGMFDGGVESALIRFSESNFAMTEASGLTPSFAIKFLRDGIESVNLFGASGFEPSNSWNFFENDFSNRLGFFENEINQNSIQLKFGEARTFIFSTGLGEFARMKQDAVEIVDFVTPYQLRYEPTEEVAFLFDSEPEVDANGNVVGFQEQLMRIPEGTPILDVYARDQPENWPAGSTEHHIARINLRTPLTTSAFGDQRLFFQHEGMRWDHAFEGKWSWHMYTNKLDKKTPLDHDYLGDVQFPDDRDTAKTWVQKSLELTNCPFAWLFK